ncbi:hypothetical protein WJX84_011267 [Apatococcus fuscideae]|uniref:TFIIS N-terminal domain-containing protein n=1 Tax=Apatococcus fuscideae TaxID=2026836 RepID=A0AAW1TF38_9CHLO
MSLIISEDTAHTDVQNLPTYGTSNADFKNSCACCLVSHTQGCWRKGWSLPQGFANLCNRCGLRYKRELKAAANPSAHCGPREKGIDPRSTFHFTYSSQPDYQPNSLHGNGPPFACTNRADVVAFLASFGATRQIQGHSLIPVIPSSILRDSITPSDKAAPAKALLHAALMQPPQQQQAPPSENLAGNVNGSNGRMITSGSAEQPYAESDLSAHVPTHISASSTYPEQTMQAADITFVSYREASGEIPGGQYFRQFLLQHPNGAEQLAAEAEAVSPGSSRCQYRLQPEFGGHIIHSDDDMLAWLRQATASCPLSAHHSGATVTSNHPKLQQRQEQSRAEAPGAVKNHELLETPARGSGHHQARSQAEHKEQSTTTRARRTNPTRAAAACHVCGDLTHGSWACPYAAENALDEPSEPPGPSTRQPAKPPPKTKPTAKRKASPDNQQSDPAPLSSDHRSDVQEVFASQPHLWEWVSELPDAAGLRLFSEWNQQLEAAAANIQHLTGQDAAAVLGLLQHLENQRVNLKLLEASGIAFPVTKLQECPVRRISQMAGQLASKWRGTAADALRIATQAINAHAASQKHILHS